MKRVLLLLSLFVGSVAFASAQAIPDSSVVPDKFPAYKTGLQGWLTFLERNLDRDLPTKNGAPIGTLKVLASFVVGVDGSVSDIIIETDPGYNTGNEVKRILRFTDKRWTPAILHDKPIPYRIKQSITFLVN